MTNIAAMLAEAGEAEVLRTASNLKTPLAIGGFLAGCVFIVLYVAIGKGKIFSKLQGTDSFRIIRMLVGGLIGLAFLALIWIWSGSVDSLIMPTS